MGPTEEEKRMRRDCGSTVLDLHREIGVSKLSLRPHNIGRRQKQEPC